jgi:hypothetical protein
MITVNADLRYAKIVSGLFIERPNRFVAGVLLDGREEWVHVKNTGRCREILIPGTKVYLEESGNAKRKYRYKSKLECKIFMNHPLLPEFLAHPQKLDVTEINAL